MTAPPISAAVAGLVSKRQVSAWPREDVDDLKQDFLQLSEESTEGILFGLLELELRFRLLGRRGEVLCAAFM